MHVPSVKFQTLTVLSPLAEASTFSIGEKAISQTPLLWPLNVRCNLSPFVWKI